METSNSCVRTLIFDSSSFIVFLCYFSFYSPFFAFSRFFLPFPIFLFGFLLPFPFPFFFTFVLSLVFRSCKVSSLAYPNLLGIKGLIVVVVV
jgi:hypothetical protein